MQQVAVAHEAAADEQERVAGGVGRFVGPGQERAHAAAPFLAARPRAARPRRAGRAPRAPVRRASRCGGRSIATRPLTRRRRWARRVGERQPQHRLGDVRRLGRLGLAELGARRRVEEQVAHLDLRADRDAGLARVGLDARLDGQLEARRRVRAGASPASAATPPRSTAAPRRESRTCAGPTDRRPTTIFDVAWRRSARRASSGLHAAAVVDDADQPRGRRPRSRRRCAARRRRARSRPAP